MADAAQGADAAAAHWASIVPVGQSPAVVADLKRHATEVLEVRLLACMCHMKAHSEGRRACGMPVWGLNSKLAVLQVLADCNTAQTGWHSYQDYRHMTWPVRSLAM